MGKAIKVILGLGLIALAIYLGYKGLIWVSAIVGIVGAILAGGFILAIILGVIVLVIKAMFMDSSW